MLEKTRARYEVILRMLFPQVVHIQLPQFTWLVFLDHLTTTCQVCSRDASLTHHSAEMTAKCCTLGRPSWVCVRADISAGEQDTHGRRGVESALLGPTNLLPRKGWPVEDSRYPHAASSNLPEGCTSLLGTPSAFEEEVQHNWRAWLNRNTMSTWEGLARERNILGKIIMFSATAVQQWHNVSCLDSTIASLSTAWSWETSWSLVHGAGPKLQEVYLNTMAECFQPCVR